MIQQKPNATNDYSDYVNTLIKQFNDYLNNLQSSLASQGQALNSEATQDYLKRLNDELKPMLDQLNSQVNKLYSDMAANADQQQGDGNLASAYSNYMNNLIKQFNDYLTNPQSALYSQAQAADNQQLQDYLKKLTDQIKPAADELTTQLNKFYAGVDQMYASLERKINEKWPNVWTPPAPQAWAGEYAANNTLDAVKRASAIDGLMGPESLAITKEGRLYTGFQDGTIAQLDADGKLTQKITNTGGRPLGIRCHPNGQDLIIADAKIGLIKLSLTTKEITLLANTINGQPFRCADDLDISQDGKTVYFTISSLEWNYEEFPQSILQHSTSGKLVKLDLATRQLTVLMDGLCFANGVSLGPNEDYVAVSETGFYRIHRFWLKGSSAGQSEVWIENLPGFPDNIRFNGKDKFWVAIPAERQPYVDQLADNPISRALLIYYSYFFPLPSSKLGCVLGFDTNGKLVANYQSQTDQAYNYITQATEYNHRLYISGLTEANIAYLDLNK